MPEPTEETFLQKRLRLKAEREAAERPQPAVHGTSALRVAANDPRAVAWVQAKLDAQLEAVASAPEGERNHTLNAAAYTLGRLVPTYLDGRQVAQALMSAALTAGLDDSEARATIRSGLTSGMDAPREVVLPDEPGRDLASLVVGDVPVTQARPRSERLGAEPAEPDPEVPNTWLPLDLSAYIDGTYVPEKPAILLRTDSAATIYPSRVHWLSGEPEALKSWLALLGVAQVLHRGGKAVYIDLEDGPAGVVGRLLGMGVPGEKLRPPTFSYIAPHEPLRYVSREALTPHIAGTDLLVIDACTESLALQQMSPKDDVDVASWLALLPRWATRQGPAVLVLDHVIKDPENRGRWATGSQHKLAGLDGVAFMLEAVTPGGVGMRGRSRLYVSKDRHGQVRPATVPVSGNKQWLGDLVVDSTGSFVDVVLHPPTEHVEEFRPTVLMERVAQTLVKLGKPLSGREINDRVKGRDADIRKALACLIDEGFVEVTEGPRRAVLHALVKPFPPEQEAL